MLRSDVDWLGPIWLLRGNVATSLNEELERIEMPALNRKQNGFGDAFAREWINAWTTPKRPAKEAVAIRVRPKPSCASSEAPPRSPTRSQMAWPKELERAPSGVQSLCSHVLMLPIAHVRRLAWRQWARGPAAVVGVGQK